eukprot:TRINITY_DN18353_c0_g1_i2.p1 TRINITY_DN18353_c0_g1~~TRINITY_DN18353_c0_g1_i2.p1  ORF type:complete len:403 (-),score=47.80 TRINITY_DN18353_c0_g1_i2:59-1237(-)
MRSLLKSSVAHVSMYQGAPAGYDGLNPHQRNLRNDLEDSLFQALRQLSTSHREPTRSDDNPAGPRVASVDHDGRSSCAQDASSMRTYADSRVASGDFDATSSWTSSTSRPFSRNVTPCASSTTKSFSRNVTPSVLAGGVQSPLKDSGPIMGFTSQGAVDTANAADIPLQVLPAGINSMTVMNNSTVSVLRGATTVMIKPVPSKYTQRKLLREILRAGFEGKVDFIYLPLDPRSHTNRGFGFCNLETSQAAERFYEVFQGSYLSGSEADKPLQVSAAEVQGFEANAEYYLRNKLNKTGRCARSHPIFLRGLPPHLQTLYLQQQQGQDLGGGRKVYRGEQAEPMPPLPTKLLQLDSHHVRNQKRSSGAAAYPYSGAMEFQWETETQYDGQSLWL